MCVEGAEFTSRTSTILPFDRNKHAVIHGAAETPHRSRSEGSCDGGRVERSLKFDSWPRGAFWWRLNKSSTERGLISFTRAFLVFFILGGGRRFRLMSNDTPLTRLHQSNPERRSGAVGVRERPAHPLEPLSPGPAVGSASREPSRHVCRRCEVPLWGHVTAGH